MSVAATLIDLFAHDAWARERVLAEVASMTAEQLDTPFEMGRETLRKTLVHDLHAIEGWTRFCRTRSTGGWPSTTGTVTPAELSDRFAGAAHERLTYVRGLGDAELLAVESWDRGRGSEPLSRLDMLLHTYNHSVHHRAQALNMLRHLGVSCLNADFLYYKLTQPTVAVPAEARAALAANGVSVAGTPLPPKPLSVAVIRRYFADVDAVRATLWPLLRNLDADALRRPFEIGPGSLGATLGHLFDAEVWWLANWTATVPPRSFPKRDVSRPVGELLATWGPVAEQRCTFVAALNDAELDRVVSVWVRDDLQLPFRLGETLIQLAAHETHHRAQLLNMLRHVGVEIPKTDLI